MRLAVHVVRMERRNSYSVLVRKPEGRKPLGRPTHRQGNNIKMEIIIIIIIIIIMFVKG
jgi:hypothetical protein